MVAHTKLEPPDGGWGILVCVGMALPFVSALAALPSFGLIFGDFLKDIGAETSAIAFITSFFFCALSFTGLFSGSLFKRFGIRKVGLFGGLLYFGGSVVQVFANSTWTLTIAFSILQGSGFGLIIPTSYTTFNNYFVKKRVMWMSFAQTLIGIGSMLYPLLMQKLLDLYGFRGCLLILAAINAHAILGMILMQPVEWHMRKVECEIEKELEEVASPKYAPINSPEDSPKNSPEDEPINSPENASKNSPEDEPINSPKDSRKNSPEDEPINSPEDAPINQTPLPIPFIDDIAPKDSIVNEDKDDTAEVESEAQNQVSPLMHQSRKHSKHSKEDFRLLGRRSSSIMSLGNWSGPIIVSDDVIMRSRTQSILVSSYRATPQNPAKATKVTIWQKIVDFLDLTLLKNPIYLNIVLGISFALYSDIAFFTLQPLYLFEIGFTKPETASIIAIGAAADLFSRIFLAFSAIFIEMPSRYIYLGGSFFAIIARFAFLNVSDFLGMACTTAVLGFLRTWVHVPLPLVFAEYLPKERYGTGYGLFMFLQGNILFVVGPIVGYLRDTTNDYILTFHVINFFMALCAVPWIIEIICVKFRRKPKLSPHP